MIPLTDREQEILDILKQQPMIPQKELAKQLGITRSAVAVHITNLIQKGHIKGKGYVFKDSSHIVCMGGANIDITGIAGGTATLGDSNIGTVRLCAGGVGRNIAENFARISGDDITTYLATCVGADIYGDKILTNSQDGGVDISLCEKIAGEPTASYLSVIDKTGEMISAVNDMEIINHINGNFIDNRKKILLSADAICLDTNLSEDTLNTLCENYNTIPIFVDTVSSQKANRIGNALPHVHTIKPNRTEAEMLSGVTIKNDHDLDIAATRLHNIGVKSVYISMGEYGTFASSVATGDKITTHQGANTGDIISTNGVGDAYMAGLLYAYLHDYDLQETVQLAQNLAFITAQHPDPINPAISVKKANKLSV